MREEWKPIIGYPGYEVSNTGKVRSYWDKQKKKGCWGGYERVLMDYPVRELLQSDDGNGYMKVYLQNQYKRTCKKVHKLVADAFLPLPEGMEDPTVDHIISGPAGKLNNCVTNLRWMSRADNIRKAYKDGVCDERIRMSRKEIVVYDTWMNRELYFESVTDTADFLGIDQSNVSHALTRDLRLCRGRYEVGYLPQVYQEPKEILRVRSIGEYGYADY